MSTKAKVIATALVGTIVGFMLSPDAPLGAAVFGAPDASGPEPTGGQVAALVLVGLVESIGFGLGIALLAFGLPAVRRVVARPYAMPVWLTISWALVSWVPHTALHRTVGHDMGKLIAIEYAFHVTLVLGAIVLAKALVETARGKAAPLAASARGVASAEA